MQSGPTKGAQDLGFNPADIPAYEALMVKRKKGDASWKSDYASWGADKKAGLKAFMEFMKEYGESKLAIIKANRREAEIRAEQTELAGQYQHNTAVLNSLRLQAGAAASGQLRAVNGSRVKHRVK